MYPLHARVSSHNTVLELMAYLLHRVSLALVRLKLHNLLTEFNCFVVEFTDLSGDRSDLKVKLACIVHVF